MVRFMMFNKQSKLFHSFLEKQPFLRMSASWFLVSTFLIWILRSKLTLSNNQSSATLWVLDTCLIVGLLPLIIILITASLSSKMYISESPWQESVLLGTWSTWCLCYTLLDVCHFSVVLLLSLEASILLQLAEAAMEGFFLVWGERNVWMTILSPASRDMISDSVEPCDNDVCFLHNQFTGTTVRLPNKDQIPFDVDLSLPDHQQSPSLGTIPIDNAVPCYAHDNIVSLEYDDCTK